METNNKHEITIVSLSSMDKLAVGDIFLFYADGYKYVFLGLTPDGLFCYKRCENRSKRKYACRRNKGVFLMDAAGEHVIIDGKIFVNYDYDKDVLFAYNYQTK